MSHVIQQSQESQESQESFEARAASGALYLSRLRLDTRRADTQRDLADCHQMHRRLLSAFPDDPDLERAREHYGLLYRVEEQRRSPLIATEHGAREQMAPDAGGSGGAGEGSSGVFDMFDVFILAQSNVAPEWSRLPVGYALEAPEVKALDPLYAELRAGMTLRFRLRANPTRRIRRGSTREPTQAQGKRVPLHTEDERLAWLRRKADAAGFRLLSAQARHSGILHTFGASSRPVPTHAPKHAPGASMASEGYEEQADTIPVVSGQRRGTGALTFGSVTFEGSLQITDIDRFRSAIERGIGNGKAYGFGLLSIAPERS